MGVVIGCGWGPRENRNFGFRWHLLYFLVYCIVEFAFPQWENYQIKYRPVLVNDVVVSFLVRTTSKLIVLTYLFKDEDA